MLSNSEHLNPTRTISFCINTPSGNTVPSSNFPLHAPSPFTCRSTHLMEAMLLRTTRVLVRLIRRAISSLLFRNLVANHHRCLRLQCFGGLLNPLHPDKCLPWVWDRPHHSTLHQAKCLPWVWAWVNPILTNNPLRIRAIRLLQLAAAGLSLSGLRFVVASPASNGRRLIKPRLYSSCVVWQSVHSTHFRYLAAEFYLAK